MRKHIFGSAALALGLLSADGTSAQTTPTLTTLHSFNGSDGAYPYSTMIADASGAFYGTTPNGGTLNYGTVFKLTPPAISGGGWTETVLYSFAGGGDGGVPFGGLISDASGALYGTTFGGGSSGVGTVFKLTPPAVAGGNWTETVLYSFLADPDGANPYAGLISDASGALYGTTLNGGSRNYGAAFKLTPPAVAGGNWTETVLHSFNPASGDGAYPYAGLISDASGALYGTTYVSGTQFNNGAVFKLTPPAVAGGNWTETVLYYFAGGADGANPQAGLIADASGALYGTTFAGGGSNYGAVFKLTPPAVAGGNWTETVLHDFGCACPPSVGGDGAYLSSSLLLDAAGNLYGTGQEGGSGYGAIFKLAPPTTVGGAWTATSLHDFLISDGAYPAAGLIADATGALYGTTVGGGTYYTGTVFQLTLPATFTGVPGQANCAGQSISFAAKKYGGIAHAAESLGYASVTAFQSAVVAYCGG